MDEDDKYNFSYTFSILTIAPATVTVTADSYSRPYGGANPPLTYSYSGFVNGEDSTVIDTEPTISTLADGSSNAGDYEITLAGGVDDNYEFNYVMGTLTVTKIPLDTKPDTQFRVYGESNPDFTLTYIGFVNGDDASVIDEEPTMETVATEESNVGDYFIEIHSGFDNNYTFDFTYGVLRITKAELAAKADDKAKAYGETNPDLTITYTGLVNDDDASDIDNPPALATVADESSIPGTYAITLTGGDDNNYTITNADGILTVNKAVLTVAADDKEKSYADDNPELTFTYAGFVNGETEADLDEQPTIFTTADAASSAGTYPISLTGGSDSRYDIVLTDGVLTVNPVALEVTAEDKTKVYGEAVPELTYTITGFVAGENESDLSSPVLISTDADESSDAGVHAINVSGAEAINYSINFIAGELSITKATLTATADDQMRGYGESNPDFTVSYDGFVNGDDAAVIDEDPVGSTIATETSDIGTYEILLSGGSDNNYDFTLVSGVLTIGKADQTITFPAIPDAVVGDEDFSPGATASSGLEVTYMSSNTDVATITAEGLIHIVSAGTVTITASQSGNDNFNAADDVDQTLTITEEPDGVNSMSISALSVYPNPSQGALNIATAEPGEEITFRVYDLTGNVILSLEDVVTPYQLYIEQAGVYFVHIENKGVVTMRKIVIE